MHRGVKWDKDKECKDARKAIQKHMNDVKADSQLGAMQRLAAVGDMVRQYRAAGLTVSIQGGAVRVGKG